MFKARVISLTEKNSANISLPKSGGVTASYLDGPQQCVINNYIQ